MKSRIHGSTIVGIGVGVHLGKCTILKSYERRCVGSSLFVASLVVVDHYQKQSNITRLRCRLLALPLVSSAAAAAAVTSRVGNATAKSGV